MAAPPKLVLCASTPERLFLPVGASRMCAGKVRKSLTACWLMAVTPSQTARTLPLSYGRSFVHDCPDAVGGGAAIQLEFDQPSRACMRTRVYGRELREHSRG